jgi:hypothetical protein
MRSPPDVPNAMDSHVGYSSCNVGDQWSEIKLNAELGPAGLRTFVKRNAVILRSEATKDLLLTNQQQILRFAQDDSGSVLG